MASRARILLRLGLLLGLPLVLVASLFGYGVKLGLQYRPQVLAFERDWLRMDVVVPDPPAIVQPTPEPAPVVPRGPEVARPPAAHDEPAAAPVEAPGPQAGPQAAAEIPLPPAAETEAMPEASAGTETPNPATDAHAAAEQLRARYALPVTVRVRVLVDRELLAKYPEWSQSWIDEVQQQVARTSRVYESQFGIALELVGVSLWPVVSTGMSGPALLTDLAGRPPEGADVVLGWTVRGGDTSHPFGLCEVPDASAASNASRAVVRIDPSAPEGGLRNLLHQVAHLFGATDVIDPQEADWQAGSWMGQGVPAAGDAPWIDAKNRRLLIERKDKPFAAGDR